MKSPGLVGLVRWAQVLSNLTIRLLFPCFQQWTYSLNLKSRKLENSSFGASDMYHFSLCSETISDFFFCGVRLMEIALSTSIVVRFVWCVRIWTRKPKILHSKVIESSILSLSFFHEKETLNWSWRLVSSPPPNGPVCCISGFWALYWPIHKNE